MKKNVLIASTMMVLMAAFSCGGSRSDSSHRVQSETNPETFPSIRTVDYEHVFNDDRPFAQCHASTMISLGGKEYLGGWFAGSHEKHDDAGIWTAKGKPGNWSAPQLLMRSSSGNSCRSDSEDCGKNWSPVEEISLSNKNSGIDVAHLGGAKVAVIYNPASENRGARYPISVSVSLDNRHTWGPKFDIEKGEGEEDELSYPAMFYEEGNLGVCYTWNRQRVAFWKGKLEGI